MRVAFLAKRLQLGFDLLRIISPVGHDFGVVVIADYQQLVAVENLIRKLERSFFQFVDVGADGQRVVDQQHDARGRKIGSEVPDVLLDTIVEQRNVFGGDGFGGSVGAGRDHVQQGRG